MSISRITEVKSSSAVSFDDAIEKRYCSCPEDSYKC